MAGHSKWANIRHRKGAQDAKRGKLFTKIAKEITVAAKLGGDDLDANPRLRAAVTKARSNSMPKDNIDRAIKKGLGSEASDDYFEKIYEGYGPGGIAVVVECLTDNVNRTVSDIRHAFSRAGGNLGTDGSVSWMFHKKGQFLIQKSTVENYETFFDTALEHGAEDIAEDDPEVYALTCLPEDFLGLKDAIEGQEIPMEYAELTRIPENYTAIDEQKATSLQKLVDALEDSDDVQNVFHNAQVSQNDA